MTGPINSMFVKRVPSELSVPGHLVTSQGAGPTCLKNKMEKSN